MHVVREILNNVRDKLDATSLAWLRGLLKATPPPPYTNTSISRTGTSGSHSPMVTKPLHTVSKEDHLPADSDKGQESNHDTEPETAARPHDTTTDTHHDTDHPSEEQEKDKDLAKETKMEQSKMEEEFTKPLPAVKTEKGTKEIPDHSLVPKKSYVVEEVDLTQDVDTDEQVILSLHTKYNV